MLQKIKSNFTFPLNKKHFLKEGKDFTVVVKIGGGKKTAIIKFTNATHRENLSEELHSIAKNEGIELVLDIAA